ncbi:MAG: DUF4388 domain-containing protein [bacterium]|nr:DUF4388 domain-containing protein [bacterium]
MALTDLLQMLEQGRRTGTLKIHAGRVEKSVFFQGGQLISSSSTDPTEFLGHFLVSQGLIDEDELAQAVLQQERVSKPLGRILVEREALSEEDLEKHLQLKAEESILELFTWDHGEFEFFDGVLPAFELVPVSMSLSGLILDGMECLHQWDKVRAVIPSDQVVPVSVDAHLAEGISDERQCRVVEAVNDDRTIQQICLEAHATEHFVSRTIYELVEAGRVKVVRPRIVQSVEAVQAETRAVQLLADARSLVDQGECEAGLRYARAAQSLEPRDAEVQQLLKSIEADLRKTFIRKGVLLEGVPVLSVKLEEMKRLDLAPEAGFILSRINGSSDVASIVKISPMGELDAMVVFSGLLDEGYIRLAMPM